MFVVKWLARTLIRVVLTVVIVALSATLCTLIGSTIYGAMQVGPLVHGTCEILGVVWGGSKYSNDDDDL